MVLSCNSSNSILILDYSAMKESLVRQWTWCWISPVEAVGKSEWYDWYGSPSQVLTTGPTLAMLSYAASN